MKISLLPLLFGSALLLAGCGNDLEGEWRSKGTNPLCATADEGTMEMDDNLEGSGTVTLSNGTICFECDFDVPATDTGDDTSDIELEFDACTLNELRTIDLECKLDDDTLECDSGDVELEGSGYEEWERVD